MNVVEIFTLLGLNVSFNDMVMARKRSRLSKTPDDTYQQIGTNYIRANSKNRRNNNVTVTFHISEITFISIFVTIRRDRQS